MAGTSSSRSQTRGTDTLYGRFDTSVQGPAPSSDSQSTPIASAWTMRRDPWSPATSSSTSTSTSSISTAVTSAPVSSSARVSAPRPGPTSTTRSPSPTPASSAMRRTVLGSTTKFWPNERLGRIPKRSRSPRASVRVSVTQPTLREHPGGHHPVAATAGTGRTPATGRDPGGRRGTVPWRPGPPGPPRRDRGRRGVGGRCRRSSPR